MNEEITVIDDFLPKDVFLPIQEMFFGLYFPWYWNEDKVLEPEGNVDNLLDNYQFTHIFYDRSRKTSDWNIEPLIDALDVNAIVKIKANLNTRTSEVVRYGFHTDTDCNCTTAVYYINTNNGYTQFKDGRVIESVENRIVLFNSNLKHSGTSCTDKKKRIVVNINYF